MQILICPDKYRGTATAAAAAQAISDGFPESVSDTVLIPLADGGEGTLDALGGANRVSQVTGPLGDVVSARWRIARGQAVIEMAEASGLLLAGGPNGNDPLSATTSGTGELISEAKASGARRIIIGVGGSASTDGGLGAIRAMEPLVRFGGVDLLVACDVETKFLDAPAVFGPQKGASSLQIQLLERRLQRLSEIYIEEYGIDVTGMQRSGAAGGLAGGLAAVGADLLRGFDLIAEELTLEEAIASADLVITGEGRLDSESFNGKVIGGVASLAERYQVPVIAVVGSYDIDTAVPDGMKVISLVESFGEELAHRETTRCLRDAGRKIFADL